MCAGSWECVFELSYTQTNVHLGRRKDDPVDKNKPSWIGRNKKKEAQERIPWVCYSAIEWPDKSHAQPLRIEVKKK